MAAYALLYGAGRSAAQNPNIGSGLSSGSGLTMPFGSLFGGSGSIGDLMGNLDPLGNWITSWGGDPLNIYGNKDNPNALLFPGPSSSSASAPPPAVPGGGMLTGINPQQQQALMAAYNNFSRNLGIPGGGFQMPGPAQGGGQSPLNMGGLPGMSALSRYNASNPIGGPANTGYIPPQRGMPAYQLR